MSKDAAPTEQGVPELNARSVDRRLRIGIGLTVAVVIAVSLSTELGFWDSLGIGLFYLLLPSLSIAQLPLLRVYRVERIPIYLGSGATILAIGTIALVLGLFSAGAEGLGLSWISLGETAAWAGATTLVGLGMIGVFRPLERWLAFDSPDIVLELIPRTATEKLLFVGLSLAAGVGEEIVYRGYALAVLQPLALGPGMAVALSSAAFGLLHAYQGPAGVARTGVIGLVLAIPVVLTGSLVPAMVAHTLIDLIAGFVIGPRMVEDARTR